MTTSPPPSPAAEYAALSALIKAAENRKADLAAAVLADHLASHAKNWATPYGGVTIKNIDATPSVGIGDETALLAWVQEFAPTEVETVTPAPVTRVRPAFRTVLLERLVTEVHQFDGDDIEIIVDTATGETVEWAQINPPAARTVSMVSNDASAFARVNAEQLLDEGLLSLLPAGAQS